MNEEARKKSYRLEQKVAAEYLAEKLDEIIKKHTSKVAEQRSIPPLPEKQDEKPVQSSKSVPKTKPKLCPNTAPKKAKLITECTSAKLKSNVILSKTVRVNKMNLNTKIVKDNKAQSSKAQIKKPDESAGIQSNDLNVQNLSKLESSSSAPKNPGFEASSVLVNPSETQSLLEDKTQSLGANLDGSNSHNEKSGFNRPGASHDPSINKGVRSKSANNERYEESLEHHHEVIPEESHMEVSHFEKEEKEEVSILTCEKDLEEITKEFTEATLQKIREEGPKNEYTRKIVSAFIGLLAGSCFQKETLEKPELNAEEMTKILENTQNILDSVKRFKSLVESKSLTEKNIFYTLETLNKSHIALESINSTPELVEISHLSLFLQKAIEFYKVYKNQLLSEKIRQLNNQTELESPSDLPKNQDQAPKKTLVNDSSLKNQNSPGQNPAEIPKTENFESKPKQNINKANKNGNGSVPVKKVDDLTNLKREIQEIKDQNSKLQWEIERDRRKMERLNELQAIQREINEGFEMERKFKEYLKEKEKNERNYLISIKKDTIEIMKMKKELENQTLIEQKKEICQEALNEKKWKQRQEEERKKKREEQAKQKIIIVQENREIKKRKEEQEKKIMHKEIKDKSPQASFDKQFKELLKKKNELKKEYEANLSQAPNGNEKKEEPLQEKKEEIIKENL